MDFFRRLGQQLRDVWNGMSSAARILFVVIGFGVVVALVIFLYPKTQSHWATLYSNLSPDEAQTIADKLQSQGIAVRVSSDGRTVEVPPDRVGAVRIDLASQGLPSTAKGYELFDQVSLGTTPFTDPADQALARPAGRHRQFDPATRRGSASHRRDRPARTKPVHPRCQANHGQRPGSNETRRQSQ